MGVLMGVLGGALAPGVASAEAPDAAVEPALAAAHEAGAGDHDGADPAAAKLRAIARRARVLLEGGAIDAAPQTLFDVTLEDDSAVDLEAARLGALLREVDAAARARGDAGARRASADAGQSVAPAPGVSPSLWQARLELDQARLAFYMLPAARRHALVSTAQARQADASAAPSEADLRAKEAEEERIKALQVARDALSEAERLVSEEYARLLGVERAQAILEKQLVNRREAIAERRETTLGWQRRARDARKPPVSPDAVDRTYDALRGALRTARDVLHGALDVVAGAASEVPQAGPDPLAELQTGVDTGAAREERERVETAAGRLVIEEKRLREEQASQLLDEIDTLNAERLLLLPFLSSGKRSAITGFTSAGADQAASEVRQLALVARYHHYAAGNWLASLRHPRQGLGLTVGAVLLVALQWLVAIGAFVWARRRTPVALQHLRKRAVEADRQERLVAPSLPTRALTFALHVHRPLEALTLALFLAWLLPPSAAGLLEVQLVTVIVHWILGGALVVVVVNALAGAEHAATMPETDSAALRLRSLRLVGRVVVGFGLVLVLTSRLVGPGTVYEWVLSTCWIASIPVLLLLVRWWRDTVFRRTERIRKKSPFEQWVLANRAGWKSFLAATVGGIYLFARGTARAARSWIGRFTVTRRVLAYLFRRELGKLEAERTELVTGQVPDAAFEALGPEAASGAWLPIDVDAEIEQLSERLRAMRGGVVAVVGSRGMGKSVLLRRLHERFPDTLLMAAPQNGEAALRAALGEQLGLPSGCSLDVAGRALATSSRARALLLDDAHRFVQPVMGGLATFDALLATACASSAKTTWVFAMDEVIWQFLKRARGARPMFDEVIVLHPWREEQIIELLRARTTKAGLTPSFERLLEKLPPNADEIDKQEALERRAGSYYRLLWDYAAGNPGVALHMWRRSLGAEADGSTHVRFFQAPETDELERLPDAALFVLRAVLQLAPASPDEIGRATMLNAADVADALRYAQARMYVEEDEGRYTVSWTWFRALALCLKRRHLLVTS